MTSERQIKEYHFYSSLIVFSNVSNALKEREKTVPPTEPDDPNNFVNNPQETGQLLAVYKVLLARLLTENVAACAFMKHCFPKHREHTLSSQMAHKTDTRTLCYVFKDEKKLEDCVSILDETTKVLADYFEIMHEVTGFKTIPYYGDQLTRVRLQGAKFLRAMAPDRRSRFDDIGPFLSTLWHMKQDFLEKTYKLLWDKNTAACRDEVSLRYFASLFKTKNVNGNVKSNYAAHENLLLTTGTHLILAQFMETWGITSYSDWPTCIPVNITELSRQAQTEVANSLIDEFLLKYDYGEFTLEGRNMPSFNPSPPSVRKEVVVQKADESGRIIRVIAPQADQIDHVMSYCTIVCQCALQIMTMNDIAHEGDVDTVLPAIKYNLPFFYRHSSLSKYFAECVDFILKAGILGSEADKLRLRASSFVNPKGGQGNCHEIDLHMEHYIRNQKDLIAGLGANKSEAAMRRVTAAADTVARAMKSLELDIGVKPVSARHVDSICEKDIERSVEVIGKVRPFRHCPGRKFKYSGKSVPHGLFVDVNVDDLRTALRRTSRRLSTGGKVTTEDDSEENADQSEEYEYEC